MLRIRHNITLRAADVIYWSIIRPAFDYSDALWTC